VVYLDDQDRVLWDGSTVLKPWVGLDVDELPPEPEGRQRLHVRGILFPLAVTGRISVPRGMHWDAAERDRYLRQETDRYTREHWDNPTDPWTPKEP
jgi:hypothetical protein